MRIVGDRQFKGGALLPLTALSGWHHRELEAFATITAREPWWERNRSLSGVTCFLFLDADHVCFV